VEEEAEVMEILMEDVMEVVKEKEKEKEKDGVEKHWHSAFEPDNLRYSV
jgi:hypothetical protein